jgi:tetratricopeptide (TPR) repeat protein
MGLRMTAALAIGLLGFAAVPLHVAGAVDMNPNSTPYPTQPTTQPKPTPQPTTTDKDKDKKKPKDNTNQNQPKTQGELFLEGYRAAHALIYRKHDYAAGIAKLKSIGQDDHPDVANLIGYSSRKLGRYDDAKYWYEKALAADPNHARTWSYYGMWHAEQGNVLKARDYLAKVQSICGTTCREYAELKGVIEGTRLY